MQDFEEKPKENRILVFEALVKKDFDFLEKDYGFKLLPVEKDINHIQIQYESSKVFLKFYYGSPSYELDFYFGRIGIEDQPGKYSFTSGDLLYLEECKGWAGYSIYSAYSYENLHKCLPKLASLLKECGKACLQGKDSVYEKMFFSQEKDRDLWAENQKIIQIKQAAADAWERKNYASVVELLGSIPEKLTALEYKMLQHSRKRSKG